MAQNTAEMPEFLRTADVLAAIDDLIASARSDALSRIPREVDIAEREERVLTDLKQNLRLA